MNKCMICHKEKAENRLLRIRDVCICKACMKELKKPPKEEPNKNEIPWDLHFPILH